MTALEVRFRTDLAAQTTCEMTTVNGRDNSQGVCPVTTNAYKKSPSATSKEAVDLTREQHPNRGAQEQFAEPLLTEKQAAAYLNMVVKTLQNWRWRGDGPPFRQTR